MKIYDASGFNSKLTGSFTGSFYGDGSNLSGIVTYTKSEISGSSNLVSASLAASISSITGFPFNGSAVITGSLLATTFVSASSITGSFKGDGSGITGLSVTETQTVTDTFTSVASKTVTHNFDTKNVFVSVYLNDDTQIIPSEVKTIDNNNVQITLDQNRSGRVVVGKAGHVISGSVAVVETSTVTDTFSNTVTKTVNHGFDTKDILVNVYTSDDEMIIPSSVNTISSGSVRITFDTPRSGRVVVAKGGHLVSGSQAVDFNNVQNKPTLISSSAQIASSDLDMNGNKVLFANVYSGTGDLPSAATYHGMFAHVHSTGQGYFAHAGQWVELATSESIQTSYLKNTTDTLNGDLTITGSVSITGAASKVTKLETTTFTSIADIPSTSTGNSNTYVMSYNDGGSGNEPFVFTGNGNSTGGYIGATTFNDLFSGVADGATYTAILVHVGGTTYYMGDDINTGLLFTLGTNASNRTLTSNKNANAVEFSTSGFGGSSSGYTFHDEWGGAGNQNCGEDGNFRATGGQVENIGQSRVDGNLTVTGTAFVTGSKVYNNNTSSGSLGFWQGSQTEYDAISSSADPNTLYIIRS